MYLEPGRVLVFGDVDFCESQAHADLLSRIDPVREPINMSDLETEADRNNGTVVRELEIIWWSLKRNDVVLYVSNLVSAEEHHHM